MTLEKQLEDNLLSAFATSELSSWQFVTSRQSEQSDYYESDEALGVIAVKVAYRQHDNFSLSPVSIPVTVSINTRIELDPDSTWHEQAVQAMTDVLADWHRYPTNMDEALNNSPWNLYYAGELRITGGTGRVLNKEMGVFTDDISFIIRGAERFFSPTTKVTYKDGTVWEDDIVGEIGRYTVQNKSNMSKIEVGTDVTSIGFYAFDNCNSLTSMFIPETVTSIGDCAFMGCHYIEHINLPESISSIGHTAFSSCVRLTSVVVPRHVTSLEQNAFSDCYALSSIKLPDDVFRISNFAFKNCTSLTAIDIPDNVDPNDNFGFGYQVFQGCSSLISAHLPEATNVIQQQMFDGCTSLSSVVMPQSLTIISMSAFNDCSSLTGLVISNELTGIRQNAFQGCTSMTSLLFKGKTLAQVQAMDNYPWGINDTSIISAELG